MRTIEPGREGLLLRELRLRSGVSQHELARRSGYCQSHISSIERGEHAATLACMGALFGSLGYELSIMVGPPAGANTGTPALLRRQAN